MGLYVGTSGFSYRHWLGKFYPDNLKSTDQFSYYIKYFNSVEINTTFYHNPRPSTVKAWKEKVPDDFVFTFKGSQYISHTKQLQVEQEEVDLFFICFSTFFDMPVKPMMLWQFAWSFEADLVVLERFLKMLPHHFRYAFEFRHPTWFNEDTYSVLADHNIALVLADSPKWGNKRRWPLEKAHTADFIYLRFHGSVLLYTSPYSEYELDRYAGYAAGALAEGKDVFAYFNNDAAGHAPTDALKLKDKILSLNK